MKNVILIATALVLAVAATGCGSLRTPESGPRSGKVYYRTFFGVSIESALYGDSIIVCPPGK